VNESPNVSIRMKGFEDEDERVTVHSSHRTITSEVVYRAYSWT